MMGHLKASEFTDFLEGIPLSARKAAHLETCESCRRSLDAVAPCFADVSEPAPQDLRALQLDVSELRESVRDQLLARAVKKSSFVPRWTRQALTPAAAWSLTAALLVSALTLGGFWHYRTEHQTVAVSTANETGLSQTVAESSLFVDDPVALETEALAWSDVELFVVLNELEDSEEETLRELIALTFEGDDGV
jgi:hypothetical protein